MHFEGTLVIAEKPIVQVPKSAGDEVDLHAALARRILVEINADERRKVRSNHGCTDAYCYMGYGIGLLRLIAEFRRGGLAIRLARNQNGGIPLSPLAGLALQVLEAAAAGNTIQKLIETRAAGYSVTHSRALCLLLRR